MVDPVQDLFAFGNYFLDIAQVDPLSALLLLLSAITMLVAVGVFGVLALLGIIDWLVPEPGPSPERP